MLLPALFRGGAGPVRRPSFRFPFERLEWRFLPCEARRHRLHARLFASFRNKRTQNAQGHRQSPAGQSSSRSSVSPVPIEPPLGYEHEPTICVFVFQPRQRHFCCGRVGPRVSVEVRRGSSTPGSHSRPRRSPARNPLAKLVRSRAFRSLSLGLHEGIKLRECSCTLGSSE